MRADGKRIKSLDPLFLIIPHIMVKRYDSEVATEVEVDYLKIKEYLVEKRKEGIKISSMAVFITAYLRTVSQVPELNRFVMNKKIYARNEFWVSFSVLKKGDMSDDKRETVVKLKLNLDETIFDVEKKLNEIITVNRAPVTENAVDKLAKVFMGIPLLSRSVINVVKYCDKLGLLPKSLLDGIPFHTSVFITNLASINTGSVFHHTYDFGTTSIFFSIGKLRYSFDPSKPKRRVVPIGIVVDERICPGVTFARGYSYVNKYLSNPSLLEVPPKEVKKDMK